MDPEFVGNIILPHNLSDGFPTVFFASVSRALFSNISVHILSDVFSDGRFSLGICVFRGISVFIPNIRWRPSLKECV